jgi:hypothetical protein
MALGTVEKMVSESKRFAFPYPPELAAKVQAALNYQVQVQVSIESAQLWNIVEQVRNLILNWALELEKADILGEDMQFSEQEKGDAEPVTQQFIIQNVGVLGNVTDQARVTTRQTATATVDLGQVRDFLEQARVALPQLPKPAQEAVRPVLEALDGELNKEKPNPSKIRAMLASVRKVGEGVAGNLAAQGIVAIVRAIVGA